MIQVTKRKFKLSHVNFKHADFCHFVYSNGKIGKKIFVNSLEFHTFLVVFLSVSNFKDKIFSICILKDTFFSVEESTSTSVLKLVIHYVFWSCKSQFCSARQASLDSLHLLILMP